MLDPMILRLIIFMVFCLASASSAEADWPGTAYIEVRAYAYNPRPADTNPSILKDGHLNPTVLNKDGLVLTADQTKYLLAAVTGKHPDPGVYAACFNPRHAFVFYDVAHRPVAWVEICFDCGNAEAEPGQKGQIYDVAALLKLVRELKLPLVPRQV